MNPNRFNRVNIFSQLIRIRFLHSSAALSSVPLLPTTAATSSSPSSSFTFDFLVNSCGLSSKSALSVSNKFQLNDKKTPKELQSVLQFLKSHHFSDAQVSQLIVKHPQILNCKIHNNLKPRFEYLMKIGFEGELLPHLILSNVNITRVSLASQIKPSVQFLKLFFDNHEKFLMVLKRASWLLSTNSKILLQQTSDVLMKEGVPAHDVKRLFILYPRCIFQNPDKLITAVNSVKSLGFEPIDTMFIHAFRVMMQMSELTWKRKIEVMKSMGFREEDSLKAFKQWPQCLAYSEENIRKTLRFYFNTMKLEPHVIIGCPALLGYSIEKRVRPRHHVVKVLESKKLVKGSNKLTFLVTCEKNFREKYIDQFIDEIPGLLEFYLCIKEGKNLVLDGEEVSFPLQLE